MSCAINSALANLITIRFIVASFNFMRDCSIDVTTGAIISSNMSLAIASTLLMCVVCSLVAKVAGDVIGINCVLVNDEWAYDG